MHILLAKIHSALVDAIEFYHTEICFTPNLAIKPHILSPKITVFRPEFDRSGRRLSTAMMEMRLLTLQGDVEVLKIVGRSGFVVGSRHQIFGYPSTCFNTESTARCARTHAVASEKVLIARFAILGSCHLLFSFFFLDETDVVGSDYRCFVRGPSRR